MVVFLICHKIIFKINSIIVDATANDFNKLVSANSNSMTSNKCVIYGNNGAIRVRELVIFANNNNFVTIISRP